MFGDTKDFGQALPQDRQLRPHIEYPTANVEDLIMVEDVPVDGNYVALYPGQNRQGYTNLKLVSEKELAGTGAQQFMRRIWATDRLAQDAYNAALKYASASASHRIYIRKSTTIQPSDLANLSKVAGTALDSVIGLAITAGGSGYTTATLSFSGGNGTGAAGKVQLRGGVVVGILLTAGGTGYTSAPTVTVVGDGASATVTAYVQDQAAILIDQSAVPTEGPMGNLFYDITRVYMTLPGPVLTAWKIDGETQTAVQVDTQLVAKAASHSYVNPDGSTSTNTYATVPPTQTSGTLVKSAGTITFNATSTDGDTFILLTPNGTSTTFEMDSNRVVGVASSGGLLTFYANPTAGTITLTTHAGVAHIFELVNGAATSGSTQVSIGVTKEMTAMNFAAAVNNNGNFTCTMPSDTSVSITRVATGADNQTITFTGTPAQVETATAVGTISGTGILNVTITGAALGTPLGTPLVLGTNVTNGDTIDVWANHVKNRINSNAEIFALYTATVSGPNIILTAKSGTSHDPTLNIAMANSTSANASLPIATSANTTAGCIAKTNFSGGATESGLTSGNTAVTIGGSENASATALAAAFTASGYFTTSVNTAGAHPIITVTRVAYGAGNLTISGTGISSGRATTTSFVGGANLPATVEYEPLSTVHGQLTTVSLPDFGGISRTEYSDVQYEYPRIITGIYSSALEMDGGQVKVTTHVVARANRRRTKQATTTITYNTFANLAYDAPFDPALIDIIYDGWFINLREQNVWLELNAAIRFNTNSQNPIYGYVGETFVQAGQGTFPTGTKTISCRIRPWKYGLYRKEVTTISI